MKQEEFQVGDIVYYSSLRTVKGKKKGLQLKLYEIKEIMLSGKVVIARVYKSANNSRLIVKSTDIRLAKKPTRKGEIICNNF